MKKNLLLLFTLFSLSTHAQSLLVEYAEKQNISSKEIENQINSLKQIKGNVTEDDINQIHTI